MTMTTTFVSRSAYWAGDPIEDSEPAFEYHANFDRQEAAYEHAAALVGQPAPWPGRTFEPHFEVSEIEDRGPYEAEAEVNRWVYEVENDGTVRLDEHLNERECQ